MVIPHFLGMIIGYLLDIISYLTKINFTISSIRIKKFCTNSVINTDRLQKCDFKQSFTIKTGIKKFIYYEYGNNKIH